MADPSDYDYPIPSAYQDMGDAGIKAFDKAHIAAGRGLTGKTVYGPDGKPVSSVRGILHQTSDGRQWWVNDTSPQGRFYKQRLQTGPLSLPNATPEDVSPNNMGKALNQWQDDLTQHPFNEFLRTQNNPNPYWFTDKDGNEIPATDPRISPGQLKNAHQILEAQEKYKNHDATGVQNFFNNNAQAINTLDKIKSIMGDKKTFGDDSVGTLQYYANGALNWAKLTDQEKATYPDFAKLNAANKFIGLVRQAQSEIGGMKEASQQDKGANLSGVISSVFDTVTKFIPGVSHLEGGAGSAETLPSGVDVRLAASSIDGIEKTLKQNGVKDMMTMTSTNEYPVGPQLRKQYDNWGHELFSQGIHYGDNPLDHSEDLNETFKPKATEATPAGFTPGPEGTGATKRPGATQPSGDTEAPEKGGTTLIPETGANAPPPAVGVPKVKPAPIATPAPTDTTAGAYHAPPPVYGTSTAQAAGGLGKGNQPTNFGDLPIIQGVRNFWNLIRGPNQQTPLAPPSQSPTPAPIAKPTPERSVSQNDQLPKDAAMGAPLGSPDNPIQRQEHVDALPSGTPFYWADHKDPYVKV